MTAAHQLNTSEIRALYNADKYPEFGPLRILDTLGGLCTAVDQLRIRVYESEARLAAVEALADAIDHDDPALSGYGYDSHGECVGVAAVSAVDLRAALEAGE
jgi:hypothetical protein